MIEKEYNKITAALGGRKVVACLIGLLLVVLIGMAALFYGGSAGVVEAIVGGIVQLVGLYVLGNTGSDWAKAITQRRSSSYVDEGEQRL